MQILVAFMQGVKTQCLSLCKFEDFFTSKVHILIGDISDDLKDLYESKIYSYIWDMFVCRLNSPCCFWDVVHKTSEQYNLASNNLPVCWFSYSFTLSFSMRFCSNISWCWDPSCKKSKKTINFYKVNQVEPEISASLFTTSVLSKPVSQVLRKIIKLI